VILAGFKALGVTLFRWTVLSVAFILTILVFHRFCFCT
jgi:hypothetical protein